MAVAWLGLATVRCDPLPCPPSPYVALRLRPRPCLLFPPVSLCPCTSLIPHHPTQTHSCLPPLLLSLQIAMDVARALAYLHSKRIVHLDVKSANVLLSRDGTAKLGDVGMARIMANDYVTGVVGTLAW